ncbi:MAG: DUF1302 domain-containing protein [Alphaproteobacteria bacterium]|nr:DUF1302 domain-containing protein [Alphaproteobacteria bacterium]
MLRSKVVRVALMGSAAAVALMGAASTAQAVETKFGEVQIIFDTTVSMGASMRTADRETEFLPEGNGGNRDPRTPGFGGGVNTPAAALAAGLGGRLGYQVTPDNNDGSVNTDDGRLNFDSGDLIGANVKANHDLQIKYQNYTIFARAVGFYDVIMNDHNVGERSELTDAALGDVGRNYELLDAFISADYTIADLPVNLRVGKQVINWGESTFILHGNNVFNPIDVGAFRRPGSEIKEALVPVNAVSGSVSLPFDVSISGYYALDWEPFELDPSGTPFSGADIVELGSGIGGNELRGSFLTGSPASGARRNCTPLANANSATFTVQQPLNALLPGSGLLAGGAGGSAGDPSVSTNGRLDCTDDNALTGILANTINYQSLYAIGRHEEVKWGLVRALSGEGYDIAGAAGIVQRKETIQADDSGQWGISGRYYADWLGGTEFGAYYQNYHSRLPFISEVMNGAPVLGIAVTGDVSNQTAGGIGGRQLLPAGCGFTAAMAGQTPAQIAAIAPGAAGVTAAGTLAGVNAAYGNDLQNRPVMDPQNLLDPAVNAALVNAGFGALALTPNAAGSYDHVLNTMRLNCALAFYQSSASLNGVGFGLQTLNGAENLIANPNLGLIVEYPEDIEIYGLSFNTTIWGWGVQGDFSYRPAAPFQVDTDSLTITGAWLGCSLVVGSPAASTAIPTGLPAPNNFVPGTGSLTQIREADGSGAAPACAPNSGIGRKISGVLNNEMFTANFGTTATFTQSDWWVDMLGGDLGVLVSEFGFVHVPDVATQNKALLSGTAVNGTRAAQYQATGCNGSNLGLGGLLGFDSKGPGIKAIKQCRPDDTSMGMVLLARMDYNNAFNSGWVVTPQIAYGYDFWGTTPSPYGNFLEDRQSIGLSVTGTLNNNLRVGGSYTNFFGGHINNKAKDQDFASVTASYTF